MTSCCLVTFLLLAGGIAALGLLGFFSGVAFNALVGTLTELLDLVGQLVQWVAELAGDVTLRVRV